VSQEVVFSRKNPFDLNGNDRFSTEKAHTFGKGIDKKGVLCGTTTNKYTILVLSIRYLQVNILSY